MEYWSGELGLSAAELRSLSKSMA
ncbi:MAG: hypothetical protein ACJ72H_28995 [Candidatus Sulfotelmatobacter sp.]